MKNRLLSRMAKEGMREPLESLIEQYCTTRGYRYVYGTAGFRDDSEKLDTVMFATGIVACLRSQVLNGKPVGVMITASHNPSGDNGVKVVEPDGSMLIQSWESTATELANLLANGPLEDIKAKVGQLTSGESSVRPQLIVGRDSRVSGPHLLSCLVASATSLFDAKITDYGLLTTPQLHFLTNETMITGAHVDEQAYFAHFLGAWDQIAALQPVKLPNVVVDCANGIGGPKMSALLTQWGFAKQCSVINDKCDEPELLNHGCGADFVKTSQGLPNGVKPNANDLYCSFDGDADRVVFYYLDQNLGFHLLDGDKISTLFAYFVAKLLKQCKLDSILSMGVVQTAYANGSSTKYLQDNLQVPVSCTKTGVKHLHHEAVNNYDIGIYFEANGHGTVMFSNKFHETVTNHADQTPELKILKYLAKLINQTVGDAISDMMAVLTVLSILQWSPSRWDREFTDLPNKLTKVVVSDRSAFTTTDQERRLVSPAGLQDKIDEAVARIKSGRSFVRASGTEDAVRVYAEAATQSEKDQLSSIVGDLVREYC